jgi:hypothetical protein
MGDRELAGVGGIALALAISLWFWFGSALLSRRAADLAIIRATTAPGLTLFVRVCVGLWCLLLVTASLALLAA